MNTNSNEFVPLIKRIECVRLNERIQKCSLLNQNEMINLPKVCPVRLTFPSVVWFNLMVWQYPSLVEG